jgi:hypothetical protein
MIREATLTPIVGCAVSQEDLKLEFVRQIYKECREQHGDDDEQTGLILKYISILERQQHAYQRKLQTVPSCPARKTAKSAAWGVNQRSGPPGEGEKIERPHPPI